MIRTISLFSGCGGMDLGAREAGCSIIFANDIDPEACLTLGSLFQEGQVIPGDVADIQHFPEADLVIGGYPCQSFSMGGLRRPDKDPRTILYLQYARCLSLVNPKYFVAENVSGLQKIQKGKFLQEQVAAFESAGKYGYTISLSMIDAKEFGIPQTRKRVFVVGVRKDLQQSFVFPSPTHGKANRKRPGLLPFASHGEAIKDLPLWPSEEFYERPHDPDGHFSWYYMSRNRKAPWDGPSYTVVANWRHMPLHPASPVMKLTWSNLADGWKQRWDFSQEYEHIEDHSERPILRTPRRLSWKEASLVQTFPSEFEPAGSVQSKFNQIGNAVPPALAKILIGPLIHGDNLVSSQSGVLASGQMTLIS